MVRLGLAWLPVVCENLHEENLQKCLASWLLLEWKVSAKILIDSFANIISSFLWEVVEFELKWDDSAEFSGNFFLFLFQQTGNSRFVPRSVVDTKAILSLDEDIRLNSDEVNILKGLQFCSRVKTVFMLCYLVKRNVQFWFGKLMWHDHNCY